MPRKTPELITSHEVLEPVKQAHTHHGMWALLAKLAARSCRGFCTLSDGCWQPIFHMLSGFGPEDEWPCAAAHWSFLKSRTALETALQLESLQADLSMTLPCQPFPYSSASVWSEHYWVLHLFSIWSQSLRPNWWGSASTNLEKLQKRVSGCKNPHFLFSWWRHSAFRTWKPSCAGLWIWGIDYAGSISLVHLLHQHPFPHGSSALVLYVYLYIYIHVCVCVCVVERSSSPPFGGVELNGSPNKHACGPSL